MGATEIFKKLNQRVDKFFDTSDFKPVKFSKKAKYTLLFALALLNIAMRWPKYIHERGFDSVYVHSFANSIYHYNAAKWIVNPFSYFGLTPDTYPSGVPFLLAEFAQISGLTLENSIILLSIFIGLFGMFTIYLCSTVFFKDDRIRLMVTFAFSLSPLYISWTMGGVTSRILLITIIPLLISLFFIEKEKKDNTKKVFLIILFFFISYFIHRMAILLLVLIIIYVAIFILNSRIKYVNKKIHNISLAIFIVIILILFSFQLTGSFLYFSNNYRWETGYFFSGDSYQILILNMIIDYAGRYGLFFLISLIGFIFVFFKTLSQKSNLKETYVLMVILFFIPLLLLWGYMSLFLLAFFSLCIGYGLILIFKSKAKIGKYSAYTVVSLLLLSSVIFSIFMINHWDNIRYSGDYAERTESWNYDCALYLNENNMNWNLESNTEWIMFIEPYSKTPSDFTSEGNRTFTAGSLETFMTKDSIFEENLFRRRTKLHEFDGWTDPKLEKHIQENRPTFIKYNTFSSKRALHEGVPSYKYKIYDTEEISIYYL